MSKKWTDRLWRKFGFLLGPLGLAGCDKTTESYRAGFPDKVWPDHSFLVDRSAVLTPLRQQATNGAVAGATLYNYYFELDTPEPVVDRDGLPTGKFRPATPRLLSPWGKSLLDRLARHANGQTLCVYVQTAVDTENMPGDAAVVARARAELDAKRVKEVHDFMAARHPDLAVAVAVIDPDPVGMSGPESRNGYNKMVSAPTGFLPADAILGASIGFSTTLGGQGGGGGSGGFGTGPGQPAPPIKTDSAPSPTGAPGGLSPSAPGGGAPTTSDPGF